MEHISEPAQAAERPGRGPGPTGSGHGPAGSGHGPAPVALGLPDTTKALRRYRRKARYLVNAGAALLAAAVTLAVLSSSNEDLATALAPPLLGLGLGALGMGGALHVRARRMRRVLGAGPWVAHASVATPLGSGAVAVVLAGGPAGDELLVLSPQTVQWRYHLVSGPAGVLWWCGDPRTGGVLAPPGGEELVWARPLGARRSGRILARPQVRSLVHRPPPHQPQPQPSPHPSPTETGRGGQGGQGVRDWRTRGLSTASAPGYAAFAAEAERQARLRGPDPSGRRPGTGGRAAPWWRVPALLKISQALKAVTPLAYALAVGVSSWMRPGLVPGYLQALAAVLGFLGLLTLNQALRHGIPRARRLARHAVAPDPESKRYVLLYELSGTGPDPLLLIFPADAGSDTPPDALLRLVAPGPDRHPWYGLPAPAGTAELRGRRDGPPLVVPWIEGRPYWPLDEYEELDVTVLKTRRALEELLTTRA